MRKFIAILAIFAASCSTVPKEKKPTTHDLMQLSYFLGCVMALSKYMKKEAMSKDETAFVQAACAEKAIEFNPKRTNLRER